MLGRSVGLSEDKIHHVGDAEPPEGVYEPSERAIVRYGRKSTLDITVDDETYGALTKHYALEQVMEIWALVGVANMVNRFHATFHTDVDPETLQAVESGDKEAGSCPLPMPDKP
jgi:alkylhydroperoxidase family enzyme